MYLTSAFQRMPPWGQSPESRKLLSKQLKGATEGYSRFGAPKNTCESGLSNIYPTWFACLPATDFLKLLCISVPQFLLLFVVLCSYSLSPLIQKFLTFRCLLFPQEFWYLICIFNIWFLSCFAETSWLPLQQAEVRRRDLPPDCGTLRRGGVSPGRYDRWGHHLLRSCGCVILMRIPWKIWRKCSWLHLIFFFENSLLSKIMRSQVVEDEWNNVKYNVSLEVGYRRWYCLLWIVAVADQSIPCLTFNKAPLNPEMVV